MKTSPERRANQVAYNKIYRQSEKGKLKIFEYRKSEKYKAHQAVFQAKYRKMEVWRESQAKSREKFFGVGREQLTDAFLINKKIKGLSAKVIRQYPEMIEVTRTLILLKRQLNNANNEL